MTAAHPVTHPLDAAARPVSLAASSSFTLGRRLRGTPYLIQGHLAAGGMGRLLRARHVALERPVVIKVLHERHRARPDFAGRLRDEARMLSALSGKRTPVVYDVGELGDGRPYFVMERLFGADLKFELTRWGVFAIPAAVRLTLELLHALEEVHTRGILHRDIKLENVFLCTDGRLVLLDFGVAREEASSLRRTGCGVALGTPRSMAPEQLSCASADQRSDLYAVGLLLYELITGEGPFDELGGTLSGLRRAHCQHQPPRPSSRAPQPVPPALEAIIARALSKNARARFADAAEMARALTALARYPFDCDDAPTVVDP